jgi:PITH domain
MDPPECSGHSHDHDHGDELGVSLRKFVDVDRVTCLNEDVERLSAEPSLLSTEGDPEILLFIPFTEAVTIHSIIVRNASTSSETSSPRRIKLFADRETLDFDEARELESQQELELLPPDHFPEG